MRVLLVEDDKPLSNALAVSLQNANYVVDCVFTGHDALVTLQAGENDIVIPYPHREIVYKDPPKS